MIQNEIFNDKSFLCEIHPEQSMKLICHAEKCPYKRRFICLKCLMEEKKEQDIIATLQDFIKDPISILDKNKEYQQPRQKQCDELLVQIDEFKIKLQQVQQEILVLLDDLKVQVSCKNKNDQEAQEEVLKRLRINEFQQQLTIIWKMDVYQGTQEFALLEKQLNNIVLSWKECYHQVATQKAQQSKDIQQQLSIKMDNKLKLEKILYDNLRKSLSSLFAGSQTEIPAFIHQEISKGKKFTYDLIHQGTRDGLNSAIYWQKCNLQSHLLTIITLKNGNIFGGYIPDDKNQQFLFQQNKQEIYKFQNKQYHFLNLQRNPGPIFGRGLDVYNDFMKLGDLLGYEYDITGYNVVSPGTHLIGDKDIQIVECKVFKIKFI